MSRFDAFVGGSVRLNDPMRLNRASWKAIDNVSEWSNSLCCSRMVRAYPQGNWIPSDIFQIKERHEVRTISRVAQPGVSGLADAVR